MTPSVRPLLVPASPTALATDPETTTMTAIATVTAVLSPGKKKIRLKKKAIIASRLVGLADDRSANVGHGGNDTLLRPISILRPPAAPETDAEEAQDGGSGARTPTASGLTLTGKKGKRIGRKEREREKAKKDKEREKSQTDGVLPKLPGNLEDEFEFTFELEKDEDEDEDDEDEEEDIAFSSSSNSGQPSVGLTRGERAHIHRSLAAGVYKSTPTTPGTRTPKVRGADITGGMVDESGPKPREKKKKVRTRASKTLIHSQSFPDLKVDNTPGEGTSDTGGQGKKETKEKVRKHEVTATTPEIFKQDKRSRLIGLARKLQQLFPEQQADLGKVVNRLENRTQRRNGPEETNPVANSNGKRGKGHVRIESVSTDLPEDDEEQMEEPDGSEELDPRGRPPRKGDTLIHIFVDHSNILIGLLSHLKRHPPLKPTRIMGRPLPEIPKKSTHARSLSNSKSTPASAFSAVKPSSSRPLPVPMPTNGKKKPVPVPVPAPVLDFEGTDTYPIPLPSFATAARKNGMESRSLPSGSILNTYMLNKAGRDEDETNSDGYSTGDRDELVTAPRWPKEEPGEKEKRTPRHMWHAALALILERGRPVTRRVIVASSPLYQPMDGVERLGYEVRVYIRVPDLGDGMDRERHKDRDFKNGSGKSSGGSKSIQTSPSKSSLWSTSTPKKGLGHRRHLSGSTSAESGSGTGGKVAQLLGSSNLKSHHESTPSLATATSAKVKYREQGVDELLQLKLHQALAATDEVPEGATIVLATGDGNVGQFNEDGFLGPVRTALRRGWKVELYAWEDGLSRSWRREFGEGSEWGRKGMFRIIGMEQFASGLVESA